MKVQFLKFEVMYQNSIKNCNLNFMDYSILEYLILLRSFRSLVTSVVKAEINSNASFKLGNPKFNLTMKELNPALFQK